MVGAGIVLLVIGLVIWASNNMKAGQMDDRFWLSDSIFEPQWREVTKEEYVRAERQAGFHNSMGQPNEPATTSFGDTGTGRRGTTLDPTIKLHDDDD